jgi:hypothetical protein
MISFIRVGLQQLGSKTFKLSATFKGLWPKVEISLFMVMECVDPKEILDLGVKCRKAEVEASKAVADTKKVTEALNNLKQKHDTLFADFKLVKAKVK